MWMNIDRSVVLLAAVWLGCVGGCAASREAGAPHSPASNRPHAECLVCKKSADLACIDIEVDAQTPFADYNGARYYFCSEDCKSMFVTNPAKYVHPD